MFEIQQFSQTANGIMYDSLVSPEKLAGFGIPVEPAANAATAESAAFCLVAPFLVAHSRRRKSRQFLLRRFAGIPTRMGCHPVWNPIGSFTTEPSEATMACIPAPLGTSAHVHFLPTAAPAPVVQHPRRGRLPKAVVNLRIFERNKHNAQYAATHGPRSAKQEIEFQRSVISTCELALAKLKFDLALMQQGQVVSHV